MRPSLRFPSPCARVSRPRHALLPAFLWALLLVPLLLATAGCGAKGSGTEPAPAANGAGDSRPVPVKVVTLEPESVVDTIDLPADLEPDRRAVLAAEVPGTVETLTVEEGDRVAAGQLLATVDTRALQQNVAEAQAVYDRAQDDYTRAQALFEKRAITHSDLVAKRTDNDVAKARLASTELQLDKSRVEAPWAGRIAAKRVEVGDYVLPGQAMVELVDVDPLDVKAPVPAADVPFVRVGAPVTIRVSSFPGEEFSGTVVRLAAELDPASRTLSLEAELPNSRGRLRPGMLARMRIPRRHLEGALLVPIQSLIDLEDRKVVYVAEGSKAARRTVTLGPTVGDRIVVEEGLEPGDRVIVQGQDRVAPGELVEPVQSSEGVETDPSSAPTGGDAVDDAAGVSEAAAAGAGERSGGAP